MVRRPATYVRAAKRIALKHGRPVSAGEVAYVVHRGDYDLFNAACAVEDALFRSPQFARASFIGGRFSDVSLWRLKVLP